MGANPAQRFVGTCDTTGKRMYSDRKYAKLAMQATGAVGMSAYRCEHCDLWHIGHRGNLTRQQHRNLAQGNSDL